MSNIEKFVDKMFIDRKFEFMRPVDKCMIHVLIKVTDAFNAWVYLPVKDEYNDYTDLTLREFFEMNHVEIAGGDVIKENYESNGRKFVINLTTRRILRQY